MRFITGYRSSRGVEFEFGFILLLSTLTAHCNGLNLMSVAVQANNQTKPSTTSSLESGFKKIAIPRSSSENSGSKTISSVLNSDFSVIPFPTRTVSALSSSTITSFANASTSTSSQNSTISSSISPEDTNVRLNPPFGSRLHSNSTNISRQNEGPIGPGRTVEFTLGEGFKTIPFPSEKATRTFDRPAPTPTTTQDLESAISKIFGSDGGIVFPPKETGTQTEGGDRRVPEVTQSPSQDPSNRGPVNPSNTQDPDQPNQTESFRTNHLNAPAQTTPTNPEDPSFPSDSSSLPIKTNINLITPLPPSFTESTLKTVTFLNPETSTYTAIVGGSVIVRTTTVEKGTTSTIVIGGGGNVVTGPNDGPPEGTISNSGDRRSTRFGLILILAVGVSFWINIS